MWPWYMKMPTQNLLRLLLLLMLMMRIVLATVCCRFWSLGLVIKLNFCSDFELFGQDFEVEVQLRFWRWGLVKILKLIFDWSGSLVEILKLDLVKILKLRFSQYFDANVCLILNPKFDQDLCKNLCYDPSGPLCLWQCFFIFYVSSEIRNIFS